MKKVHLCTDHKKTALNPAYQFIQIRDGYAYATNGLIAVKIPQAEIFGNDLFHPDDIYYLTGESWKQQKASDADTFYLIDSGNGHKQLKAIGKKFTGYIDVLSQDEFNQQARGYKYPDIDTVTPTDESTTALNSFSLSFSLYHDIMTVLETGETIYKAIFGGRNGHTCKLIDGKGYSQAIGLIMQRVTNN